MQPHVFGTLPSGETIHRYTLTNRRGASLDVITLGGIVTALRVPDREGRLADVVLGFNQLEHYLAGHPYFGAITGRIAGRVTNGELLLEGRTLHLARNDGNNHLHGGRVGLDRRVWAAQPVTRANGDASLHLTYLSPDGENGYPGNVSIAVTYTLTAQNEFVIETEATTDCVTPLSLAHHSYFNLAGEGSGSVGQHFLQILADNYVPATAGMTLANQSASVASSAADLRKLQRLSDVMPRLFQAHGDLYLLRVPFANPPMQPTLAARVEEPNSGRVLAVFTDDSCLQFYTGAALDDSLTGKSGRTYGPHGGFCLECQGHPNAASRPEFGAILVRPSEPQRRRTIYAFSTQ
ncbi:aldose epimerase family protein [Oleiharenicola lentus]|uniref:aldose epimerase family protein n=1 Tax=Oleiharenicola lentus TaxID=2508720 RepID=UPI003F663548